MRILLQRVTRAAVAVDDERIGEIEAGLLLLVGFGKADAEIDDRQLSRAAEKIINLRIFPNEAGKLDHSLSDRSLGLLVVPQFTLYGKSEKGRRPDFTEALAPDLASERFDRFAAVLESCLGQPVQRGRFGADMQVSLVNDGPFTMMLEF